MTKSDNYGGPWTTQKLDTLRSYLGAYLNVLKKRPYSLLYIDAFAGPGLWGHDNVVHGQLFDVPEYDEYKKGSPLIALEAMSGGSSKRTFNKFYFIDNNEDYIDDLKSAVREKHGDKLDKVEFIQGDANTVVLELCRAIDWKLSRAVIFLDPFGTEVKWQTIEAIAKTEAMDLWVLFPLGMAVNRMLTTDGIIPLPWQKKLDAMFGTEDWHGHFYESATDPQTDLFGNKMPDNLRKIASFTKIADYFVKRLKTAFAGVIEEPLMLKNSKEIPLFSLCFAVGNERGRPIALRIAKQIIDTR